MENEYSRKFTPRKRSAPSSRFSSPPPKSGSKPSSETNPSVGSHSAPGRIKHIGIKTRFERSPRKPVTFAEETSEPEVPKKPTVDASFKRKRSSPKKSKDADKRKTRTKPKDFGSGKGPQGKKPTAEEKGKQKVTGEIPEVKPHSPSSMASQYSSESTTDSSDAQPLKKAKAADLGHIPVPESVGRWFSNKEAAANFIKNYNGKVISPLKYLDTGDLLKTNLGCIRGLVDQGLRTFLEFKHDLYPDLVKVFYCNLNVKSGIIRSKVKGKSIKISLEKLRECFQISENNPKTTHKSDVFDDFDKISFYKSLCKPNEVANLSSKTLKTGPLLAEERLLHYLVTYLVSPRGCNHAMVMDSDLLTMYAIKNRVQLNWGSHIAAHMLKSRHLQYLPFGYHISYLLVLSGVDVSGETCFSPRTIALIDRASLGKLDLGWNPELGSFDYVSDHTTKVRRHKVSSSKPSTSAYRKPSQTPVSLVEKVDELTNLVLETRRDIVQRCDKLEALLMALIPEGQKPSVAKMDTDVHPSSTAPTPAPGPSNATDDEGDTEPLLHVDTDVLDTEVSSEDEATEVEVVPSPSPVSSPKKDQEVSSKVKMISQLNLL